MKFRNLMSRCVVPWCATLCVLLAVMSTAQAAKVPVESKTLEQLHQDAVAEGGTLIMYAGGDYAGQFDFLANLFEKTFPGVKMKILADFSKFQTPRIENQIARNRLEADLVTFQNLHDFDRWKKQGLLLNYKPAGWEQVPDNFKDPEGAFVATNMVTFAFVVSNKIPDSEVPHSYLDFLDPKYKDKLVLTYPTDDDAILFQFKLIIDTYGWDFMDKLLAQNPKFVRGTPQSNAPVRAGEALATFTSVLALSGDPAKVGARTVFPDKDPFVSWASRSAIFKSAKHPAAAKLFQNWRMSLEAQSRPMVWAPRKDVKYTLVKPYQQYNTNPDAFLAFMRDRAAAELLRGQLEQYVGPLPQPAPTGENKPGPFYSDLK